MFCFLVFIVLAGLVNAIIYKNMILVIFTVLNAVKVNVSLIFVSLWIAYTAVEKRYSFQELVRCYVYAGVIQSVFVILSYFSITIRDFLNQVMVANVRYEKIANLTASAKGLRCFGFAANLFDTFGCAMSILAILALYEAFAGSKKFFIYFLMIAFSAVVNARTSMVLIFAGVIAFLIFNLVKNASQKNLRKMLLFAAVLAVFACSAAAYILYSSESQTGSWLRSGMESMISLLRGRKIDTEYAGIHTNYFGILFERFLFIPDTIYGLLFGTGMYPSDVAGKGSDVGYIQHIWRYGLTGTMMQYSFYLYCMNQSEKITAKIYPGIVSVMGIMTALFLIKSEGLGYGMPMIILIPILFASFTLLNNES